MSDETNKNYIFNMTHTELLVAIVNGEIDPVKLAENALKNRGLDNNGKWVGFKK